MRAESLHATSFTINSYREFGGRMGASGAPSVQHYSGRARAPGIVRTLRGQECPRHTGYFNTNIAFTCAVTVTFWGENSSVGAGACAAIAIGAARRIMGAMWMFSNVSTEA